MAISGQKRKGPPGGGSKATVFRKSAKRAKQDATGDFKGKGKGKNVRAANEDGDEDAPAKKSDTSGAAKRQAAKLKEAEENKNKPQKIVKAPKSYTDVRAKGKVTRAPGASKAGQGRPKTKHEFIARKQAAAAAQAAAEQAAAAKKQKREQQQQKNQKGKAKVTSDDIPALIPVPAPATRELRIVFGSYERLLYGLGGEVSVEEGKLQVRLTPQFIFPAHVSSIRTVCCAGSDSKWLATGGTDESIKIWDLRKRIEVGSLTGFEGTINSLHFPTRQYLLATGQDGRINIYRTRDWALLKTLKGHIGSVNDVAAHPSGKLALSVGKDRTIRMWDLMRGVGAASTKIGHEGERVVWDTQGTRFAVIVSSSLSIYNTEMSIVGHVQARVRWHDVRFQSVQLEGGKTKEVMFAAGEDKLVHVFDLETKVESEDGLPTFAKVLTLGSHNNRVKSVCIAPVEAGGKKSFGAVTISSDGFLRVFDLSSLPSALAQQAAAPEPLEAIASYDTRGSRLTCLSVVGVVQVGGAKIAKDVQDEAEEEEEEEVVEDEEMSAGEEEDVDTDAEEEELQRLEQQIEEAKQAGLLESDDDDDEDAASDDDDDDASMDDAELEEEDEEEGEEA